MAVVMMITICYQQHFWLSKICVVQEGFNKKAVVQIAAAEIPARLINGWT